MYNNNNNNNNTSALVLPYIINKHKLNLFLFCYTKGSTGLYNKIEPTFIFI